MASNENQDKLQVTIEPVLDSSATDKLTEELKNRVASGQEYIEETKDFYINKMGSSPALDVMLAPLERFSNELIKMGQALDQGLDTKKLGEFQQRLVGISRTVSYIDKDKQKQTTALSSINPEALKRLSQFTAELQRVAPKTSLTSIMKSDLGARIIQGVSGKKSYSIDDASTAGRYLGAVLPSIHPSAYYPHFNYSRYFNVADYLPTAFKNAGMDTGSLKKSFQGIGTKKAIQEAMAAQRKALLQISEDERTEDQVVQLKYLEQQIRQAKEKGHAPVLKTDFATAIREEFANNKRFAKVLIDAGIATKTDDENRYRLPTQFSHAMVGKIAEGLQKSYIATTAGYNSPDEYRIVRNPFKYYTDEAHLEGKEKEEKRLARLVVARGGYETAQDIIHGMGVIQNIKDAGTSAFILPSSNNGSSSPIFVPNVSRDLYRYQKYNVGSGKLKNGGSVLYQESSAVRFLNRFGGEKGKNPVQNTTEAKGAITPGIIVVDADSFDFENDEKAREAFGSLANGIQRNNQNYSFATLHRGDEGQHVTFIQDDLRKRAEENWRKEQSQRYQRNANTNVLWQRGAAVAQGKKLSYEEIQNLNPYDRAAYQMYASVSYASPLTAYSQTSVEDMPDNAKRAKTEDAINKIFSPSREMTESIEGAAARGLKNGLKLHYVRDKDSVSTMASEVGGLINNNGSVYLSSDILPYDSQIRGVYGALKGMGISIQANSRGDIYSALKQAGMLDENGKLVIGGRDVAHGLGIITESSLKSQDVKEALQSIQDAADEQGMVTGADGRMVPWQEMQDDLITQFVLGGDISSIARTIDKKNESGKIGSQFMSHLIPSSQMISHQRKMWQDLDELKNNPDKALAMVFPSENGDLTSRRLHELKKQRDEHPEDRRAAVAFAEGMNETTVQNRIQSFIESRKRDMTAGNYFDQEGIGDSSITQGLLGTSFIQRVLLAARADEGSKGLNNVELMQKVNPQILKDALDVADWKKAGISNSEGNQLSDEQKQRIVANALLLENMFEGFSEDEIKALKDKGIVDETLENQRFVFDPKSSLFELGYHRDPSTKKDVLTRYNAGAFLNGLRGITKKSFVKSNGEKSTNPYESMFRNTIAINPGDWEYLASADEDGDAVKRFAGLYYTLLKDDVNANEEMQKEAEKYYAEKFADVEVKPQENETPKDAKDNLIQRFSRSLVSRAKMAQFSGIDSRVAQLGLTAEMLADPNNTTALKYYKAMMRSAALYDYATTYEKKPLEIMMQNEDFMATALGAEYAKGAKAVSQALTLGADAAKTGRFDLADATEDGLIQAGDENPLWTILGKEYYVGENGITIKKDPMKRIDQFNLPSAFQANILTSILSRAGTQYNLEEDQVLRDFLINDEERGLGFENAIGEAEKNFLKAKRGFFIDYYTGKRTGEITDEEMEEFRKLQMLAEEERDAYVEQHRTGNPDTMKVDGTVQKISQWKKDHNRAIGYVQGRNIDVFGMTSENMAKALSKGMYFEDTAAAELIGLWTGANEEQRRTLTPVENLKPKTNSSAKPKIWRQKQPPQGTNQETPPTAPVTQTQMPAPVTQAPVAETIAAPVEEPSVHTSDQYAMYTSEDGYFLLEKARRAEANGQKEEAEKLYEQAENVIRATTTSGHTMATLAGQDKFASPLMALAAMYGITSPEDAGVMAKERKIAGDMMEEHVLDYLGMEDNVLSPLDVFGDEVSSMVTGKAKVEADKALRRDMGFTFFKHGTEYKGVNINGEQDAKIDNPEHLRGMWDGLIVDNQNRLKSVLEMKTMGYHSFKDMQEGRNIDRRYFDENGVPYAYKIQAAAYANALGIDDYTLAMTGLTDQDRHELVKQYNTPGYKAKISPLTDDNFKKIGYRVSDLEIPSTDINGNFLYEDYEEDGQTKQRLKMLRGAAALHALQSRNEKMQNGELMPDGSMQTDNKLLGARQAMIALRMYENGIMTPKDIVPITDLNDIIANASSSTAALAINNGDVGTLISEILAKVQGMPMELEQRQAVGEIGKNLLSEANNFNANMRKEIFRDNNASSSQSFMHSTQAQIENATNMLNALKSDANIKQILSEQPNTQGAEILNNLLNTLESSIGKMVDNRISAAVARGSRDVENAQKSFEETISGKDGTENQRKAMEENEKKMKNLRDMADELEASAEDDNLTKEQREIRKTSAENLRKKIEELDPLHQEANAALSKNGIDALDEAIGRQIQSPQEAAEKKISELVKKAYGQGHFLMDTYAKGGLSDDDFKQGMERLFGADWDNISDEDKTKLASGEATLEDFIGGSGGLVGTILGKYRDELFGKIRRGREGRMRSANKSLRTNEARLLKRSLTPEEMADENRYLEEERIRDSLEQYRNTFGESKDPEEQAAYLDFIHELLGDEADTSIAEKLINGELSDEELAGLGGQWGMIDDYVQKILAGTKQKNARSVAQMKRKARNSRLGIDRKIATPYELAQEMREDKEWDIRDELQNAVDKLSGVDDDTLMTIAKDYLGEDITRQGLNRFLAGRMLDEELAGLGGQWGSLNDYQRSMLTQKTRQNRRQEMSLNRRDRSLRRTLAGKGLSPEEEAKIAREDMSQQMQENLEQRAMLFGENSPQYMQAVRRMLGENATAEDARAFLSGTVTPEQMAAWGGDYAMLGSYSNYIQDQAMMRREGTEMSLDQMMNEKRLLKMQQSPFANTWGMRMQMQAMQRAQRSRSLDFRIRQAQQQLRMMNGEGLTGTQSPVPPAEETASPASEGGAKPVSLAEAMEALPTSANEAYTGAVFYGKDKHALSDNMRAQAAVVDGFAKKFGLQVGLYDTLTDENGNRVNGKYDPASNKIDLAMDAEGNLITRTMGHEMTHFIRANSEEDYKDLMQFSENALRQTEGYDFDARVQQKLQQYNQGITDAAQMMTADEAKEEVIADSMWDVLNGKNVIGEMQNQNGALGNKVTSRLGDYSDAFHQMGTNLNPEASAMAAQSEATTDALRAKFMQASANAARRRQEAMGPNQQTRYSKMEEQTPAREKPAWMSERGNPYVYGDYIYARGVARNKDTGKYRGYESWISWERATEEQLEAARDRKAYVKPYDFSDEGRLDETLDPTNIAEQEARARAKAAIREANIRARARASEIDEQNRERYMKNIMNAPNKEERRRAAKRAIQTLEEENRSYERDKNDKYKPFVPGRDREEVDREVAKLKETQKDEQAKEEKAIIDAENAKKKYDLDRAKKRIQLEDGEIPGVDLFKKKEQEIAQERQKAEEVRKAAIAKANAEAETKRTANAQELASINYDMVSRTEVEQQKRDLLIRQAEEKAVSERREKLGRNQQEEAELRAEKKKLENKYRDIRQRSKKTQFKNEEEANDAGRYKDIEKRLQEIGRENTVLNQEINPASAEHGEMVKTLPEVVKANLNYEKQKVDREARRSYLENQANQDVENEKNAKIKEAESNYKKWTDKIDRKSIEIRKQADANTEEGKKKRQEELDAFDEQTKIEDVEHDDAIQRAKKKLEINNAARAKEMAELKAQTIYDPKYNKDNAWIVDANVREVVKAGNRDKLIGELKEIAKTGELPKEEDELKDSSSDAAGAIENLGNAAENAAGKLQGNEENKEGQAEETRDAGSEESKNEADKNQQKEEEKAEVVPSSGGTPEPPTPEPPTPEPPTPEPPTPDLPDLPESPTPSSEGNQGNRQNPPDNNRPNPLVDDNGNPLRDENGNLIRMDRRQIRENRRTNRSERRRQTEEENELARRRGDSASFGEIFGTATSNMAQTGVNMLSRSVMSFGRGIFNSAINEAKNFVKQYDALMNQIQVITLKTGDDMENIAKETVQQALELKASATDVATIKADLYRQGLGDDEVNERMEQVVQFSKVTGIKASESVKIVTTAMNTGLADSAQQAMDVLAALGDAAATTADQIQKGIQKAGAAAKVAGVSYEELATLMTVGTSKTQLSGQQIGTALQTIFGRMNKVTQSNYISDLEGGTTSLNDVESALNIVGVKLREDNGTFRSSFEVLRDLSAQWGSMNDTQKSLVTNAFAGTRQSNIFQTLMEGMSEDDGALLDQYLGLANDSEGTVQSKYEIAMESLSASMDQVKTAWDAVVQAFVENDVITGFLEGVSNLLEGIANAAQTGIGKWEVFGSTLVAILGGIAVAAALAATPLAIVAAPLGLLAGVAVGAGLLALVGAANSQGYDQKVSQYKERASERYDIVQTKQNETEGIIEKLEKLRKAYEAADDQSAYEAEHGDEFNSLLAELNECIPGVVDEFGNLTLSSENLAAALEKAKTASEQKTEQDIMNMFAAGLLEARELMQEYFNNRTDNVIGATYEAFGSAESADEVNTDEYKAMLNSKITAGTSDEEGLIKFAQESNAVKYNDMMEAYAKEKGITDTIDPDEIFRELLDDIRLAAQKGTLDFSEMKYGSFDVGEYVQKLLFDYIKENMVVDQSGNDMVDAAVDSLMAYVSSDMLPEGMTMDDVRSYALKMIQNDPTLYKEGKYNPAQYSNEEFATAVLNALFNPFRYGGTNGFNVLSQFGSNASDQYAYTVNGSTLTADTAYDENGEPIPSMEDVEYDNGRGTISSYKKTVRDKNGTKHTLYFNNQGGRNDIFYYDEEGKQQFITNANERMYDDWVYDVPGLITYNEAADANNTKNNSDAYTAISSLIENGKQNTDRSSGLLALLKKGFEANETTLNNITDPADFYAAVDALNYEGTDLNQIIGSGVSADKSGASLAAFTFADTEAGKKYVAEHGDYLYNTVMNASSTNGINTAGFSPLIEYLMGEGAEKSYDEIAADGDYAALMQNFKSQLGDDLYAQLVNGTLDLDQAMEHLGNTQGENEWSSYSDEQRDLLTEKEGYDNQLANREELGLTAEQVDELTKKSEECQKGLNMLFTADQIRKTRKYGEQTEDVAAYLDDLAKGGRDASSALSGMTSKMATLSTKQAALIKLKNNGGKKDDDAFSILGISEEEYNIRKTAGTWDSYLVEMEQNILDAWNETVAPNLAEQMQSDLNEARALNGESIDQTIAVNTEIVGNGEEVIAAFGENLDEKTKAMLQNASASAKFKTIVTGDAVSGYKVIIQATEVSGTDFSGGGGGGGGGKSAAEELIDEQKKEKTLYEHMVKMVQYQQTKYQNADELGNYGLMIEKEIEVEKKRLPVIEENIKKLKEQMNAVETDSDDWYSLRDAILEAEEEYEEVNNTIQENIKKLEENQQAIYKLRTDLEDTVKEEIENRKQEESDMLSGSVSMQETILAAIKQRYQDEWDRQVHNPRIAGTP